MGYSVKATTMYADDWLRESINSSVEKQCGKVFVICKPSEAKIIEEKITTERKSKLYFLTGVVDYSSLIERTCGAEMSICYMSQSLMESCGLEGQRYTLTRLRNQGWCSGEIVYFSESDLAKLQEE